MVGLNLKLEQYEGPLDLLLSLIQKHKIDIFDIPIAELTDQYLEYIESMEKYDMQISSDFIYMASELISPAEAETARRTKIPASRWWTRFWNTAGPSRLRSF